MSKFGETYEGGNRLIDALSSDERADVVPARARRTYSFHRKGAHVLCRADDRLQHGASLQQRCARWLLFVADRAAREEYQLTHDFLSVMHGVRRATVSEAAKHLQDAGAIEYASPAASRDDAVTPRVLDRRNASG